MATNLKTVETTLGEIATLHTAMASAFAEIEAATKDKTNPHFKSKYADLGSVIDAIKPPLIKYGLFFTQRSHPAENGISVETVLHHKSGEQLSLGTLFVPANKQDAQGFGSALTYARRYALMTGFGVPAEDDDGNLASRPATRPTTDEAPPEKRVQLDGVYKSKSALWAAVRQFVHTLNGIDDLGEFEGFLQTDEIVELLDQCKQDAPQLLDSGEGMPDEYEPLLSLIKRMRKELGDKEAVA
jgi:hypothetical protein